MLRARSGQRSNAAKVIEDCLLELGRRRYAVLYRDGSKQGRTPTRSKTQNPVWQEKNTFLLENVPTKFTAPGDPDFVPYKPKRGWGLFGKRRKRRAARDDDDDESGDDEGDDAEPDENDVAMPGEEDPESSAKMRQAASVDAAAAAQRGEVGMDVRVDIFDDDPASRDFLGTAKVDWKTLMRPGSHDLRLTERPGAKGKAERYTASGTVTVEVKHEIICQVACLEAAELPQRDMFDVPDPYCVLKWGNRILGKTKVCDNSRDPTWYGPRKEFAVPLQPDETDHAPDQLEVELWESDALTSDDFLGLATVPWRDVLFPSAGVPRYLGRRPGFSEDPAPQGYVELGLRASFIPDATPTGRSSKRTPSPSRTRRPAVLAVPSKRLSARRSRSRARASACSSCLCWNTARTRRRRRRSSCTCYGRGTCCGRTF